MTETVTTPVLGIGQVEAAAERELGEALKEFSAPAQPPVPEAPAPEGEAAQASPAPETPPSGADAPAAPEAAPATPQASPAPVESPAFKKALEIYGGDYEAAAKGFLETNTRNAQMATRLRELGIDPKTLQPAPQPVAAPAMEQTSPVQPLDEATLKAHVTRTLDADPNFNQLVQAFSANDLRLKDITRSMDAINEEMLKARVALDMPEIKADSFKVDQWEAKLERKSAELLRLQLEQSILEGKQERLNVSARERANLARDTALRSWDEQAREQQEEFELAQSRVQIRAEMATAWPLAIERAAKENKVPAELFEDFKEETKLAGLAQLADESRPITDPYAFAAARAKQLMDRYDRYHRTRAAEYGKQAAARTATVAATPASTAAPSSQPSNRPMTMAEAEKALEADASLAWTQYIQGR